MNRFLTLGAAVVAVLLSAWAGYRIGVVRAPVDSRQSTTVMVDASKTPAEPVVLYWKDPDGKNDFSATPKRTADGRAYLPVYENEEKGIADTASVKRKGPGKILYYRNPMGLADISRVPKKDSMGMDYIPVYEGEEGASTVKVNLDRVQRSGVRTEPARLQSLIRPVRTSGIAKPDERTLQSVTLRADGFIEKLYVKETGAHVQAGEPMFAVYSPQMVLVQVDYWTAAHTPGGNINGALQRLRNFAVPESVIAKLRGAPTPYIQIDWPAPMTGVVMEKKVVAGQMMKAGEELYRLADLGSIWVIANVTEQDLGLVKLGASAKVSFRAFPGEVFEGQVTFILHELDPATRTAKVRIEVRNPDHRIKHEMYADVEISDAGEELPRLVVPASSVIDSGSRQVVIVDRGEGRFEPRPVKVGMRGNGLIEILDGLKEGEPVVTTATFLIDAESNLKAALQAFTSDAADGVRP